MTILELHQITDYDVFLRSAFDEYSPRVKNDDGILFTPAPEPSARVTKLLLGVAGIAGLEVKKINIVPEHCAILANIELPAEIIKAICKYNRMHGGE